MTGSTVTVRVRATLVFVPPLAVPPLSMAVMVSVATPLAFGAGVYVSVPLAAMAGWMLKRAALSLVTLKLTVCEDSFVGPVVIAVAPVADGRRRLRGPSGLLPR